MEADGIGDDGGVEAFDRRRQEVGLEGGDAGSEVWVSVLGWGWMRAGVSTRDVRGGWLGLHGVSRILRRDDNPQWVGRTRTGFGFFGFFPLGRHLDVACVVFIAVGTQSDLGFVISYTTITLIDIDTQGQACPPNARLQASFDTRFISNKVQSCSRGYTCHSRSHPQSLDRFLGRHSSSASSGKSSRA